MASSQLPKVMKWGMYALLIQRQSVHRVVVSQTRSTCTHSFTLLHYTTVAHAPVIAPFYCKQGPRRLLCVRTYDLTEFGCLSFNSSWLSLDMEESSSCSLTTSSPSGSEPLRSVRAFLFMVELESSLVSETRAVESQLPIFSSRAPDCCQSPIKSTILYYITLLNRLYYRLLAPATYKSNLNTNM